MDEIQLCKNKIEHYKERIIGCIKLLDKLKELLKKEENELDELKVKNL